MAEKFLQLSDEQRQRLGMAFIEHRADLWPHGDPGVTPAWITANVDRILDALTLVLSHDGRDIHRLPDRLYWVVPLLADLEHERPHPKSAAS